MEEDGEIKYVAEGSVPGSLVNQFSMDEKDGNLRIATTDRDNWNSNTDTNNLYFCNQIRRQVPPDLRNHNDTDEIP